MRETRRIELLSSVERPIYSWQQFAPYYGTIAAARKLHTGHTLGFITAQHPTSPIAMNAQYNEHKADLPWSSC